MAINPQQAAKVVSADELAKPTTLRMYLSEYKVVNGIKLPHLITRGSGDQVTEEWEIKSYKINLNLKADTFKNETTSNRPPYRRRGGAVFATPLFAQNNNQNQASLRLVIVDARVPASRWPTSPSHRRRLAKPVTYKSDEKGLAIRRR